MKLPVTLLLIAQVVTAQGEWVRLTPQQTDAGVVVKLDSASKPALGTCQEVAFQSNGLDVVTESQFSLVIELVVDRSGVVERFRVLRQPELPIDFTKPLQVAFTKWRYSTTSVQKQGSAFSVVEALSKRLGSVATADCKRLTSGKPPSNKPLQPTSGGTIEVE